MPSIDPKDVRIQLHQVIPRWLDPVLFLFYGLLLCLSLPVLLGFGLLAYPIVGFMKYLNSKLLLGASMHSLLCRFGLRGKSKIEKPCVVCGLEAVQIFPDTEYHKNRAFCAQHKIKTIV